MKYFAKLILGQQYLVGGQIFLRGKELQVSEKRAKYLETVVEDTLLSEGNKWVVKPLPRFEVRSEDLTVEEKVQEEVVDAPVTLKPNKPGRKPAAD